MISRSLDAFGAINGMFSSIYRTHGWPMFHQASHIVLMRCAKGASLEPPANRLNQ